MTDLKQAAQAVVDRWDSPAWEWSQQGPTADLMADLRTALAQPEQEPVALEAVYETIIQWDEGGGKRSRRELARRIVDIYTAPPAAQRPWQGLDEDEIRELYGKDLNYRDGNYVRYAKSVEAQLKERNGY
jgi:hypothetical protein